MTRHTSDAPPDSFKRALEEAAVATPVPQRGTIIDKRYKIEQRLGEGAFGSVWEATDISSGELMGQRVAIKFIQHSRRFAEHEVNALKGLSHPNIVTILNAGQWQPEGVETSVPFLVMELLHGGRTLPRGIRAPDVALWIARQLADALGFMHGEGVYHLDIKPENLYVSSGDTIVILDFGIAKVPAIERTQRLYAPPSAPAWAGCGTPPYAAPEQMDSKRWREVDGRADVHAFGILLGELLAGRPPNQGSSAAPLTQQMPGVDKQLVALVARCIEADPDRRFADGKALMAAIEELRSRRVASAWPPSAPGEQDKPPKDPRRTLTFSVSIKNPKLVWTLTVGFGILLLTLVVVITIPPQRGQLEMTCDNADSNADQHRRRIACEALCDGRLHRYCRTSGELLLAAEKVPLAVTVVDAGVAENISLREKAYEHFKRACEEGDARACVLQGELLVDGMENVSYYDEATSMKLYEQACKADDFRGCAWLGSWLIAGSTDVPRDLEKGKDLLQKACGKSEPKGCTFLGYLFSRGIGVTQDGARALQLFKDACRMHEPTACSAVAYFTKYGRGTSSDAEQAEKYYRDAEVYYKRECDEGRLSACVDLGELYLWAPGIKNAKAAKPLFEKACNLGRREGCRGLGVVLRDGKGTLRDGKSAAAVLKDGCDRGDGASCIYYGELYLTGEGVDVDKPRAGTLFDRASGIFKKGCDNGHAYSCQQLASLYYQGRGVAQDFSLAAKLFQKACDNGSGIGCAGVGLAYELGKGVPTDRTIAHSLYDRGCKMNDPQSCYYLGIDYEQDTSVSMGKDRSVTLYQMSCDGEYYDACWRLAKMYERGDAQDIKKANSLYGNACENDHMMSCVELSNNLQMGIGGTPNYERARELASKACDGSYGSGCTKLGFMYYKGLGGGKDPAMARDLIAQGCDLGDGQGCYFAARLFLSDEGGAPDRNKALGYLEKACKRNVSDACKAQENLRELIFLKQLKDLSDLVDRMSAAEQGKPVQAVNPQSGRQGSHSPPRPCGKFGKRCK